MDMAWWDLEAKRQAIPLHRLLGGEDGSVRLGRSYAQMQLIDDLMAAIGQAIGDGYRQTTLEFRPGWDLEVVRAVRQVFPTKSLRTPLCLDQSIESLADAEAALDLQSGREMNLTPDRVGGHLVALAIRDACWQSETAVACCVAADHATQIGARHALAFAVQDGFGEMAQLPVVAATEPMAGCDADGILLVTPTDGPGIGIEPNREVIEKNAIAYCRIDSLVRG